MNFKTMNRNPDKIKKLFTHKGDDTFVNENIRIVFPSRFVNLELAYMDSEVKVVSIYAILDDNNNYAITTQLIMADLTPYMIETITIDESEYFVLYFRKDSMYMRNREVVQMDNFISDVFKEMIVKGNFPAYLGYEDTVKVFMSAKEYANSGVIKSRSIMEALTSMNARDKGDFTKYLRMSTTKEKPKEYINVGLSDVQRGLSNNFSRLTGSYFNKAITSSLIVDDDEVIPTEKAIRS